MDRGTSFSSVVNVTWIALDSVTFILHFLNQFWIASRLVYSLCAAMAGTLSVASTAVSSAKVAVVDSGEVGGSAVYRRYNNVHRSLSGPPLWSSGKSSWLQIRRPGFDSRHYQKEK
jgi:hypothetical protein